MDIVLRPAQMSDVNDIQSLIHLSCRRLGSDDYSDRQIESALNSAWGVDNQLIKDKTYYLAICDNDLVGCGGWSYRETLFGANEAAERNANVIDPDSGSARIRAFFVHPDYSRRGIGSRILACCEQQAQIRGYFNFSLMATLPGQRLYRQHGYEADPAIEYPLEAGLNICFVPMKKSVGNRDQQPSQLDQTEIT